MKGLLGKLLTQQRGAVALVVFLLFTVAAVVEVVAILSASVSDWYMHLFMWIVLAAYYLLTLRALVTRRQVRAWINLIVLEALTVFWIVILASRVPAAKMVVDGRLAEREPLEILWLSIVLLGLCAVLLPVFLLGVLKYGNEPSSAS